MRMGEIEIYDYARQLLEAHGDVAVVEAARKACECEEKGQGAAMCSASHDGKRLTAEGGRGC